MTDLPSHGVFDRGRLIGLWEYDVETESIAWRGPPRGPQPAPRIPPRARHVITPGPSIAERGPGQPTVFDANAEPQQRLRKMPLAWNLTPCKEAERETGVERPLAEPPSAAIGTD